MEKPIAQSAPIAAPDPIILPARQHETSSGQRNLFAYRAQQAQVIVTPAVMAPAPIVNPSPVIVEESSAPQPIPFPYRYIGTFGPADNRLAAFKRDGEIFTIRTGERIGDFVLRSIGIESVDVESHDGLRRIPWSSDV